MRALLLLLVACVPSRAELRAPVDRELAQRLGSAPAAAVDDLLGKPLDADAAVRVALAQSPRLAAALDELGIAGSELATALAPGATHVDIQLRFGGGMREYEIDAIQPILNLIAGGRRRAAARADLTAARARATATALRLAARVERAFHDLLAAQQELELRRTAFDAADAAAIVRERMHAAGNTSDLAQARDRDAREQARIDLGRAEAAVETRRERLNALLGLSGDRTKWTAAGTLAEPPAAAPALDDLEPAAVAASLDLVSGRARSEAAANRLGDQELRAVLPELGLGVSVIDHDDNLELGPAIRIGVPLFDQRQGARARAAALLARADHELAAVAIELRAEARAARVTALAAYEEARHLHEVVLPLRQQIVDETLLHYNAMDADPFQLIVARRELVDASHQYLDALRRYANAMTQVAALRRGVALDEPMQEGPHDDDDHP
jgi:cobalt-zinc-cadmium efflux system outer membrane protein